MKADLPLDERQRIEAEEQRELRAALVRRHVEILDGEQLVAGGALDNNLRVAAIVHAKLHGEPTPTQTEAAPPVVVVVTERARPDNLRTRLGLN